LNPATVESDRQERGVADGRPHQPSHRIVKARDGIPGHLRHFFDADAQPAVPGKILKLQSPHHHAGIESELRVRGDVLYTVRKIITVELTPQPVADHRTLTVRGEGSHQAALQIESLGRAPISAPGQPLAAALATLTHRP